MISYMPVYIDNLEIVREEIYQLCESQFDVNKSVFRKIEIDDILQLPNLTAALYKFDMVNHIAYSYVNVIVNYRTHIHIDVDEDDSLQYNLLIPIKHYENTYRNYFSLVEGAVPIPTDNIIHGDEGTPIRDVRFNKDDVILDYRIRTTYPTIHNTRYPHNFESMTGLPRMMFVVMLKNTWELKHEYYDITISP